jgi:hypothetical protein
MRVVAVWAAIAGLVALVGQSGALALSLVGGADGSLLRLVERLAAVGQIAFTLLMVVFLLIVALTGRRLAA